MKLPNGVNTIENSNYRRYAPSAYDSSMSVYEELVMIREYLNKVIDNLNETIGYVDDNIKSMKIQIELLIKEIERFEGHVTDTLLPENLAKILDEWYDSGKLGKIINMELFEEVFPRVARLELLQEPLPLPYWNFRGVQVTTFTNNGYGSPEYGLIVDKIKRMGGNGVVINQIYAVDNVTANNVSIDRISNESVIFALKKAKQKGMRTMLKFMVDSNDNVWRAHLNPSDPDLFFESMKDALLKMAEIANDTECEILCIGAEMKSTSIHKYKDKWVGIINEIRKIYKGKLTYGCNFGSSYEEDEINTCSFIDHLDLAGLNMWHSYTNKIQPPVNELVDAWVCNRDKRSIIKLMVEWQKKVNKPIFFTECGCNAVDGANQQTGGFNYKPPRRENLIEQSNFIESLFIALRHHTDVIEGLGFWSQNIERPHDGFNVLDRPVSNIIAKEWGGEATCQI